MAASGGVATGLRPYSRPADPSLDARLKSRPSDPSHVGALAGCCQGRPSPCLRSRLQSLFKKQTPVSPEPTKLRSLSARASATCQQSEWLRPQQLQAA